MTTTPQNDAAPAPAALPTRAWGLLAAIDLEGCDRSRLADPDALRGFVAEVVPAVGMRAHGPTLLERFGEGDLEGWSALQFIETSSITIHADEVGARCFVDLFSCKGFEPELAARTAVAWFGGRARVTAMTRGLPAGRPEGPPGEQPTTRPHRPRRGDRRGQRAAVPST